MQEMITKEFGIGQEINLGTKYGPIHGVIVRFGKLYIGVETFWKVVDVKYENIIYYNRYNPRDCDLGV